MSSPPLRSFTWTLDDAATPASGNDVGSLCEWPGQGLHTLTSAAAYLVESRMFLGTEMRADGTADLAAGALKESIQLLRRSGRAVFLDLLIKGGEAARNA
jgi:hypothetical protein